MTLASTLDTKARGTGFAASYGGSTDEGGTSEVVSREDKQRGAAPKRRA